MAFTVALDGKVALALLLADQVRPETPRALRLLRRAGMTRIVMLTGDRQDVADAVGAGLGVDEVLAEQMPEDKLAVVRAASASAPCVMVGDGINDSPALAQADIGVAMGGAGNAQVLETADVVLMNDDLGRLPFAVRLSRQVNRLIRQNVIISLGVKILVAIAAMAGLTPLWVAVFADIGISLIVTLNGLRALRFETVTA